MVSLFHFSHLNRCVVVSWCSGFHFHFNVVVLFCFYLKTYDVEHIFMCLLTIRVSSLLRCLSLLPIFKLGCLFSYYWFESSFYILCTSPLSDLCFANNFSQSLVCLFSLLTVSDFDEVKCINSFAHRLCF